MKWDYLIPGTTYIIRQDHRRKQIHIDDLNEDIYRGRGGIKVRIMGCEGIQGLTKPGIYYQGEETHLLESSESWNQGGRSFL